MDAAAAVEARALAGDQAGIREAYADSEARGMPPAARYRAAHSSHVGVSGRTRAAVTEDLHVLAVGDRVVVNDVADRASWPGVVTGGPNRDWWKVRLHGRHARADRSYRRSQITKIHVPPAAPAPAPVPPPAAVGADVEATQLRVDTMVAGRVSALKVCAVQIRATPGDVEGNVRRAEQLIRANPGYHLYVLPELSSCGYSDEVLADCATFAHGSFDGVFKFFIDLAREVDAHICFGFLCRTSRPLSAVPAVGSRVLAANHPGHVTRVNAFAAAADVLFDAGTERTYLLSDLRTPVFTIAQAVVGPTGIELVYDKMHLCDMGACSEVAHGLTRGERPGVFTCRGWRVGVCICYDLRFPALWRRLAWEEDCDLIVHPSAFVRDSRLRRANQVSRRLQFLKGIRLRADLRYLHAGTFPMYHTFVTTRAVENGIYVLSVNFAGADFGESIAAPPWVGPVPGLADQRARVLSCDEGVLALSCETAVLDAVRQAYPYRRNAHPSLRASPPVAVTPAAVSPRAAPAMPFAPAEQEPASHRRRWTDSEISLCMSAVQTYGERRHKAIAAAVGTRTAAQVRTFLTKRKAKGGLPAAPVHLPVPPAPAPWAPPPPPAGAAPGLPYAARDARDALSAEVLAPPSRSDGYGAAEAETLSALVGLQEACQQATAASAEAWAAPPLRTASDSMDM